MIEKARHLNIERNLRFCHLCQMKILSVIEDEYVKPTKSFVNHILVEISDSDRLSDDIATFQSLRDFNCSFIVCGDMNARTKELPDMVLDDNSLHLPLTDDYVVDEYIPVVHRIKV